MVEHFRCLLKILVTNKKLIHAFLWRYMVNIIFIIFKIISSMFSSYRDPDSSRYCLCPVLVGFVVLVRTPIILLLGTPLRHVIVFNYYTQRLVCADNYPVINFTDEILDGVLDLRHCRLQNVREMRFSWQ